MISFASSIRIEIDTYTRGAEQSSVVMMMRGDWLKSNVIKKCAYSQQLYFYIVIIGCQAGKREEINNKREREDGDVYEAAEGHRIVSALLRFTSIHLFDMVVLWMNNVEEGKKVCKVIKKDL